MRRKLEFAFYIVFIAFFILRYAGIDKDVPRRSAPGDLPKSAAVLLPKGAALPRDISRSVIVDIDQKNQAGVGTAFSVDHNGTFVSARHVVEGCAAVALVHDGRLIPTSLVAKASNRDFAVLRSDGFTAKPFELSLDTPQRGEDGFMMGYPQGVAADVHATVIGSTVMQSRGRYNAREHVVAWVERERRPGFSGSLGGISGGPVFDADGRIVGTVVAGAPRRGRVYTTNPQVFAEAGLVPQDNVLPSDVALSTDSFDRQASEFRRSQRIAQVYCSMK